MSSNLLSPYLPPSLCKSPDAEVLVDAVTILVPLALLSLCGLLFHALNILYLFHSFRRMLMKIVHFNEVFQLICLDRKQHFTLIGL